MPSNGPLSYTIVLDTFRSIKKAADDFVVKNKMDTYCDEFLPRSDELANAIFCNAFEELGCPIRSAAPGTKLERIKHLPSREKFVDYIHDPMEKNAGLIEINGEEIARTSVPCPSNEIEDILEDLLDDRPAQDAELGLMEITGGAFAKCLSGNEDALRFPFGSVEVRTLMTNFYAKSALFRTVLKQLALFFFRKGWQHMAKRCRPPPNTRSGSRYWGYDLKDGPSIGSSRHTGGVHYERYRLFLRRCSANET